VLTPQIRNKILIGAALAVVMALVVVHSVSRHEPQGTHAAIYKAAPVGDQPWPVVGGVMGLVFLILTVAVYFVPAIVADRRKHNNRLAIGILNFFLGWTVVGWVGALVWACTNDVEKGSNLVVGG
jgi:hypothetical protein